MEAGSGCQLQWATKAMQRAGRTTWDLSGRPLALAVEAFPPHGRASPLLVVVGGLVNQRRLSSWSRGYHLTGRQDHSQVEKASGRRCGGRFRIIGNGIMKEYIY